MDKLKSFFEPDSVALFGATEKFGFGYGQTKTLVDQNLGDRLFLINPSHSTVFGKKSYPRVSDIPSRVELAVIIVPSGRVPSVLQECAAKGIKAAIVQSAGFAEIGSAGRKLQEQLTDIAGKTGIRIIGPNCVGIANTSNQFATTETTKEAMIPGAIGIIAQSGVFGNILMDCGADEDVYFSKVVTLGNRCDVDESELIRYLKHDEQTRVISLYLEGVHDGKKFLDAIRDVAPHKPIVILKSGRTESGKTATASHTGTLSGEDDIYAAAFNQSGALRVRTIQEFFDLSKSIAQQPIPPGSKAAILTTSGSLGAMTADALADLGLQLAELSADTVSNMRAEAPSWMNVRNPLDVGPSGLFAKGLKALMQDPNVDGVIAIFVIPWVIIEELEAIGIGAEQFFSELSECRQWIGRKPLLFTVVGKWQLKKIMSEILGPDIPLISTPENAARVFARMARYNQRFPNKYL